ncbi:hypothetical protein NB636_08055 [Oxalobacter aliiformigenes]|uniref:antiterminator Q family protein n=1 Tax=Oxalobacter aliiformigenes TaxID=2946593 RepID=UPI0022AECF66|nr:antiterminator Q family protein [Oxalobacter aliiformigenes]MCZ4065708.1 hypothetical protein [Oxalobacter aliiformigenes]WAV98660.1 hypothetical protein NB636_08055 [Oxalobacter aliiformigenes]
MRDWAEEQLKRWGEYSVGREKGVMGYPGVSPTFRLEASGGNARTELVDRIILRIDRIIAGLKDDRPDLFIVAVRRYVYDEPASSIARHARCCRDTVYARLDTLRATIDRNLRDA